MNQRIISLTCEIRMQSIEYTCYTMYQEVLSCSACFATILVQQGEVDVVVDEAHIEQLVEAVLDLGVLDGVFLDTAHVHLIR